MSASEDITNLFRKFGGEAELYQELSRDHAADESRARWPLLSSVHLSGNALAPSVKDGVQPESGAPVPNLQGHTPAQATVSPFAAQVMAAVPPSEQSRAAQQTDSEAGAASAGGASSMASGSFAARSVGNTLFKTRAAARAERQSAMAPPTPPHIADGTDGALARGTESEPTAEWDANERTPALSSGRSRGMPSRNVPLSARASGRDMGRGSMDAGSEEALRNGATGAIGATGHAVLPLPPSAMPGAFVGIAGRRGAEVPSSRGSSTERLVATGVGGLGGQGDIRRGIQTNRLAARVSSTPDTALRFEPNMNAQERERGVPPLPLDTDDVLDFDGERVPSNNKPATLGEQTMRRFAKGDAYADASARAPGSRPVARFLKTPAVMREARPVASVGKVRAFLNDTLDNDRHDIDPAAFSAQLDSTTVATARADNAAAPRSLSSVFSRLAGASAEGAPVAEAPAAPVSKNSLFARLSRL